MRGMRQRISAQNDSMKMIETMWGEYALLSVPGSKLLQTAEARFAEAAVYGDGLIYADHTVQFEDGREKQVRKPGWSPDTLLSTNYIEGPIAVRQDLLASHAEDLFATPADRYALLLELTERTKSAAHIRESLCVCGVEPPCKSLSPLSGAIRRRRLRASVEAGTLPGSFALRYAIPPRTRVSCIVFGNGSVRAFRRTLESIEVQCCWQHIEIIVADSGGIETEKERYYAALQHNRAASVVRLPACKGVSNALNEAVSKSSGEALLLLPAGVRLKAYDTVERMLEYALLPHVGAVGGVYAPHEKTRVQGIIHNVPALNDGPMMTSRDCYYMSGGIDETFAEAGFVHAYTLLHADRRLYNVITPYALFAPANEERETTLSPINKERIQDMRSFESLYRDDYFEEGSR